MYLLFGVKSICFNRKSLNYYTKEVKRKKMLNYKFNVSNSFYFPYYIYLVFVFKTNNVLGDHLKKKKKTNCFFYKFYDLT